VTTESWQLADFVNEVWGHRTLSGRPARLLQLWELSGRRLHQFDDRHGLGRFDGARDVYMGATLAGKRLPANRRPQAADAAALPGVWADIDVKDGAAGSLQEAGLIANLIVAPSMVVCSGHGLQAWWLLDKPWVFTSWQEQAAAATLSWRWGGELRDRAMTAHAARLDSVHDLARLMRPVGTVNAKSDPVPVTMVSSGGPRYELGDLQALVQHRAESVARVERIADQPASVTRLHGAAALPAAGATGWRATVVSWEPMSDDLKARLRMFSSQEPRFQAAWTHEHDVMGWTGSEWEMSLASLLAQAAGFTDPEISQVIAAHRRRWYPGDRKAFRRDYLQRTVHLARVQADARRAGGEVDAGLMALLAQRAA
jgi:hypothetical protein